MQADDASVGGYLGGVLVVYHAERVHMELCFSPGGKKMQKI